MKLPIRIILSLLCAAIIVSMPFFLSSPEMLRSEADRIQRLDEEDETNDPDDDEEEIDFGRLLFPAAYADELPADEIIVEALPDGELFIPPEWRLPLDLTPGPKPNPEKYTENGYEDQSIRLTIETREINGMTVHIAFVRIADPSQLRTAVAYDLDNSRTATFTAIARSVHPVVALNGDLYTQLPQKKTFEVRMTNKIRAKTNNLKDILIIDDQGDFHIFIRSKGLHKEDKPYYISQMKEEGRTIVNALTFGPALVVDGQLIDQKKNEAEYSYAIDHKNPRSAIGQTGPLSYVMVVVEGRGDNPGATGQELAQIMYDIGCTQAYNLDGGNTAEMIVFGPANETGQLSIRHHFSGDQSAGDRGQKDIIYFATAVPESEW